MSLYGAWRLGLREFVVEVIDNARTSCCALGVSASSRSKAQFLIRRGSVTANGRILSKPGVLLRDERRAGGHGPMPARFVSRGGEKLDGALTALGVDVAGAVVADIGASTGGFHRIPCCSAAPARCTRSTSEPASSIRAFETIRASSRAKERTRATWFNRISRNLSTSPWWSASFISLEKLSRRWRGSCALVGGSSRS